MENQSSSAHVVLSGRDGNAPGLALIDIRA